MDVAFCLYLLRWGVGGGKGEGYFTKIETFGLWERATCRSLPLKTHIKVCWCVDRLVEKNKRKLWSFSCLCVHLFSFIKCFLNTARRELCMCAMCIYIHIAGAVLFLFFGFLQEYCMNCLRIRAIFTHSHPFSELQNSLVNFFSNFGLSTKILSHFLIT